MAHDDRPGSGSKRKRFAMIVGLLIIIVIIIFVGYNVFYLTLGS